MKRKFVWTLLALLVTTNQTMGQVCPQGCVVDLEQVCPQGCTVDPDIPPAQPGCCITDGTCTLIGTTLFSNGDMDTTLCTFANDIDVILDGTWRFTVPTSSIKTLSCSGQSILDPVGNGDLNIDQLIMIDCDLSQTTNTTIEIHQNLELVDIATSGVNTLRVYRTEREGNNDPHPLGPISCGSPSFVYDVTGAFQGAARLWYLTGDITARNDNGNMIFILEKQVVLDIREHTLSVDRLRLGISTINGQSGSQIIVGVGGPIILVSDSLTATAKYQPAGTYIFE